MQLKRQIHNSTDLFEFPAERRFRANSSCVEMGYNRIRWLNTFPSADYNMPVQRARNST